jgi:hypothetical protein
MVRNKNYYVESLYCSREPEHWSKAKEIIIGCWITLSHVLAMYTEIYLDDR